RTQRPVRATRLEHGGGAGGGLAPDGGGAGGALRRVPDAVRLPRRTHHRAVPARCAGASARAGEARAGHRVEPRGAETLQPLMAVRTADIKPAAHWQAAGKTVPARMSCWEDIISWARPYYLRSGPRPRAESLALLQLCSNAPA